jgi:hypothetical protein
MVGGGGGGGGGAIWWAFAGSTESAFRVENFIEEFF